MEPIFTLRLIERRLSATRATLLRNWLKMGPIFMSGHHLSLCLFCRKLRLDLFEGESTMLTLRAPITIIGDIRGQYQDLHRWFSIAGFPPRQKVLFLGGLIDKEEPGSIDCLAFVAAMKVSFLTSRTNRLLFMGC
ncbi:unnamed protein product [Strongylus vulgaris]|uniref:Calcineurin-like phosphoesterase domain-containing protein n=1 Tax=Strongylus vulgaris TaxID=40348 RepID=A0A3P7IJ80_STRVU|nr:unnamed protein product [Strongylus vulgaris]